jgi:predicted GH43/DUF377 family glycosyl hydrolase
MKKLSLALASLLLLSCGRYADFTLPLSNEAARPRQWKWTPVPGPVLARGAAGEWDGVDVLNPSVVQRGNELWNFYSGFDGRTWHTGLAISTDGRAWTRQGRVFSPDEKTWEGNYIGANGHVLFWRNEFWHWYQAGAHGRTMIGLARSTDGRTWRRESAPVLTHGPRGSWDEISIGDPFVLQFDDEFYLFYLGEDRARRQRLGVAHSKGGVVWTKLRTNPLLELGGLGEFDENGLGEPMVWAAEGLYWMLYTGRDRGERRRLGFAWSSDGVKWQKARTPEMVIAGTEPWNSKVMCDPTPVLMGDRMLVWYGGGDAPRPDERLNGQIGLAELTPTQQRLPDQVLRPR